jgi:hypothetical protein
MKNKIFPHNFTGFYKISDESDSDEKNNLIYYLIYI